MASGGDVKRLKQFPNIYLYLKAQHPKVHELIKTLGMQRMLYPHRGSAVTFLLPDKKYTDELLAKAHGDKPQDAIKAITYLILVDNLYRTPADFEKNKGNIANRARHTLVVKSTSGSKVEVESGTLVYDSKYVPIKSDFPDNTAVWLLTGTVKLDTPEATRDASRFKPGANVPAPADDEKTEGGGGSCADSLDSICKAQEAFFASTDANANCKFLLHCCSILKYLEDNAATNDAVKEAYENARCLMTQNCYINVFMLLTAHELFPPAVMKKACDEANVMTGPEDLGEFLVNWNEKPVAGASALALSPDGITELTNARADEVLFIVSQGAEASGELAKKYDVLCEKNKLNESSPVYPQHTLDVLKHKAGKVTYKQILDEAYELVIGLSMGINPACESGDRTGAAAQFTELCNKFETFYKCDLSQACCDHSRIFHTGAAQLDPEANMAENEKVFIENFSMRIPTTVETRSSAKFVITGGDDEDDGGDNVFGNAELLGDSQNPALGSNPQNEAVGAFQKAVRRHVKKHGHESLSKMKKRSKRR